MKTVDRLKSFLIKQAKLIKKIHPQPEWKFNSFEELVLYCGREMTFASLPENIELGLPKGCYYNSLKILDKHPELAYCEGYALADDLVLPVPHAWLINQESEVIDPTWNIKGAYIGVSFNTDWLISFLESRNQEDYLSVFESNYIEDFSLLKEGLPPEAIAPLIQTVTTELSVTSFDYLD